MFCILQLADRPVLDSDAGLWLGNLSALALQSRYIRVTG